MGEQRGSMGEQRGSRGTALAREQSGGTLVSDRSRVTLSSGKLYIYIYTPNLGLGIAVFV